MGDPATEQTDKSATENKTVNPWDPQAGYLTSGFAAAKDALGNSQSLAGPTNFVSQFTPEQQAAFGSMLGYGTGNPQIAANSAAAGGALTGAGANAAQSGLYGLSNYQSGANADSIMSDARKFADNTNIDGMVDASMRDARRSVYEGAIPQNNRNAAASGNINNNKSALREGVIERGLADATADVSSNMRGQLYSQGLNLAQQNAQQNEGNRLGALSGAAGAGTGAVSAGVGANSGAVQQQGGLFNIANQGIAGQQQGSQASIDQVLAKYGFDANKDFDALNKYWNIVGGQNYGSQSSGTSTGTSTTTKTPSTMSQIGQGIGMAGSIMAMSDRRRKKNITRIGTLPNGLSYYSYEWLRGPDTDTHLGVMAQEVEAVLPEAVHTINDIKYVDYALVLP